MVDFHQVDANPFAVAFAGLFAVVFHRDRARSLEPQAVFLHLDVDFLLVHAGKVDANQVSGGGFVEVDAGGPSFRGIEAVLSLVHLFHELARLSGEVLKRWVSGSQWHLESPIRKRVVMIYTCGW